MEGIRKFCNDKFAALLPQVQAGEIDSTTFRAKVMDSVIRKFDINVNSAATHYNHSLKMQRIADPASVKGLCRPEGKKGGRKVEHPVTVIKAKTGEVIVSGVSRGKANEMIITAQTKKRAKLVIKEDLEVAPVEATATA